MSFDQLLLDFVIVCFIGRVVGVIAVFSTVSVFPNQICVWPDDYSLDDYSLFSGRFADVVDASEALVVSSEALILLLCSNWIMVLIIVSYLLYGD